MTIAQLLEERANTLGDKVFVQCESEEASYREMHERGARVAANLAQLGIGKDDKILLLMGNCLEFLYVFLGVGRIGAVCVPVNPTLKPDEICYIADDSDAKVLITIPEFGALLPQLRGALPKVERVFMLTEDRGEGYEPYSDLLKPVENVPGHAATERDDAALIYTSGTTGMPKGVVLTHRNYLWNARMILFGPTTYPSDRFLCVLPLFHVNAQVVTILFPLMQGAQVVLMKHFNPFGILPMIEKFRTTVMSAVPTIYNVICRVPRAESHDISSMRFFITGAAPLPEETYLLTQQVLKRPLIAGYGLSEATCASAAADPEAPVKWDSVGFPLRFTSLRIVGEDGIDAPFGSVGEILVAGPNVMRGYYKNPAATAEVLQDGWLRTGDLGRFDEDGYLYIVGRVKDMIIRGGQNVYPQQVENVLSRVPGIEECCVVGIEEPRWGQEILAVVKRVEGHDVTERQVLDFCREHLAAYKCPRAVRFVEALPKTATGKIRKNEVAARFSDMTF